MARQANKNHSDPSTARDDALQKLDSLASKTKAQRKSEKVNYKKNYQKYYISAGIIIIVIGSLGVYGLLTGPGGVLKPGPTQSVNYNICSTDAQTVTHYHFHLYVYINGINDPIPADMGISGSCTRPIHTHDATGLIHVEMPSSISTLPTINDVFTIYRVVTNDKATLTNHELMSVQGNVTCTVNNFSITDFINYVPQDGDSIKLSV